MRGCTASFPAGRVGPEHKREVKAIMLNKLHKLWRSGDPHARKPGRGPAPGGTIGPDRPAGTRPPPAENREPVLVRGKLWVNTSEARHDTGPEQEIAGDASVDGVIRRLALSSNADDRCAAARELGQRAQAANRTIPALLTAAVDVSAAVRKASLAALEAVDPAWPQHRAARHAVPALIEAMSSMFPEVSEAASALLIAIGAPAVPDLAASLLTGHDTSGQIHAIRLLARLGPAAAGAVPGVARALSSQFLHVRVGAAEALARIGAPPETAIPALAAGLADRSADSRRAMAACLALAGPAAAPAVPVLLPLLADRDKAVRNTVAGALERIGPKAVPALIEVVQTRDAQRLKAWAASAMQLVQWAARPGLDAGVAEPVAVWRNLSWAAYDVLDEHARLMEARQAALRVLGNLGPAAAAAAPAVALALRDPNPAIRSAAAHALGRIAPRQPL